MSGPLHSHYMSEGRVSLTSHTLISTAPDVLHHQHAERVWCICHTRLVPFQDSVFTNEKFVRLNMVGVVRKNVSISYSSAICMDAERSSPTGVRGP